MKILLPKNVVQILPCNVASDNLSVWHMTLVEVGHFWLICNFYRAQSPHFDWATFIKKAKWGRWGIEENDRLKTICALFANSSSLLRATVWKFCCCSASSLLRKYRLRVICCCCCWPAMQVLIRVGQSSILCFRLFREIKIGQSINIVYLSVTRMIT